MTALTLLYIACFQLCALPSIVRIVRRGSSADLSIWREVTILVGVSAQFAVMRLNGVPLEVWISPVLSGLNVLTLLLVIWRYRNGDCASADANLPSGN